ncbi:MAG: beta-ketoacyl-ACP synthase II [Polyangiaceae bacterium]|nr:beta-ketoacyl-ACP synthase II [Polyangiaceae bacterium]
MERVVVTGIGLCTPAGIGTRATWQNVVEGKSGIRHITLFDPTGFPTTIAGEVPNFVAEEWVPKKKIKEMGRFSHLAIAASKLAWQDAGYGEGSAPSDEVLEATGTFLGVGLGGLEGLYQQSITLKEKGPSKISPYFIPQVIGNLAGGQVAMALGLKGPSYANTSACASSAHAVGEAFEWIRRGRAPMMLCGGSEATITGLGIGGFSAMFALSRRNGEPEKASRPWDRGRDGFVCAEGSGVLVLESLAHARARGARIYCEITGYGASCDAYHLTKPAPEGEGAQRAMRSALVDAKLDASVIDYVNAHGTSTPHGDVEEARAIMRVFGTHATDKKLWVSSTKSVMGHLLGGAGGVEAGLSALAIAEGTTPPTINLEDQDPEAPLDFVPLEARNRDVKHAMSNSFGFGGTNATLILSKYVG